MKVLKVYRPETHGETCGYIVPLNDWKNTVITEIENDIEMLEDYEEDTPSISVKIIDISQEEFDNLEEFMGW